MRCDSVAAATHASEGLLNRELSWLDYNERVLDQAANSSLPLLERARSCA
jgi:polyphosphate kinase